MNSAQDCIAWIEGRREEYIALARQIWEHPEPSYKEFFAARLQADFLEARGFRLRRGVGGLPTAFSAEWGSGRPILGFAGEYDALKGLSQKLQPDPEPLEKGAPGHGCGHNLLGVGCLAAADALRQWLEDNHLPGTVRYYGCPAEEDGAGKAFMARAGEFADLDCAFNYHPGAVTNAGMGSSVAVNDIKFRFHGKTAHAGMAPHLGRSALDAVELMNVGVNYLREHVSEKVRLHYAITHGGDLPNIVPAEAEVWYFVRAPRLDELDEVTGRVMNIARGAAMMTGTSMDFTLRPGSWPVLNNIVLAEAHTRAMQLIGPIPYSPADLDFAARINSHFPPENIDHLFQVMNLPDEARSQPVLAENYAGLDRGRIGTGSTDVGDLSWNVPLCMLGVACYPTAVPGHSWGVTAAAGTELGFKGMLHAAKIMALAAMDCVANPQILADARAEFERAAQKQPYRPLPPEILPEVYKEGE